MIGSGASSRCAQMYQYRQLTRSGISAVFLVKVCITGNRSRGVPMKSEYLPTSGKSANLDSASIIVTACAVSLLLIYMVYTRDLIFGSNAGHWVYPYLEKAPDICIHYAWALVLTFREDYMDAVEEHLQIAERALERPDLPDFAPVGEGRTSVPFRDWVIGHACAIRSQILLGQLFKNIDPQELTRVSLQGRCVTVPRDSEEYAAARTRYLQRLPASRQLFEFPDFLLFRLDVASARFVGGFAQARTFSSAELRALP